MTIFPFLLFFKSCCSSSCSCFFFLTSFFSSFCFLFSLTFFFYLFLCSQFCFIFRKSFPPVSTILFFFDKLSKSSSFLIFFLFFDKIPSSLFAFFIIKFLLPLRFCDLLFNFSSPFPHQINAFLSLSPRLFNYCFFFFLFRNFYRFIHLFFLFYIFLLHLLFTLNLSINKFVNLFLGYMDTLWVFFKNLIVNNLPFIKNSIKATITFFPCTLYQFSDFQASFTEVLDLLIIINKDLLFLVLYYFHLFSFFFHCCLMPCFLVILSHFQHSFLKL